MKLRFTLALTALSLALNTPFILSSDNESPENQRPVASSSFSDITPSAPDERDISSSHLYHTSNIVQDDLRPSSSVRTAQAQPSAQAYRDESQRQTTQYTLNKKAAFEAFLVGCSASALVGGLTYVVAAEMNSRTSPTDIALPAAATLAWSTIAGTGALLALSGDTEINNIHKTRHNIEHDRRAFDDQVHTKLRPILANRIAEAQRQIDRAFTTNTATNQTLRTRIENIRDNHRAVFYLPEQIRQLEQAYPAKEENLATLTHKYNTVLRQGILISDADMAAGRVKFDAQVKTAEQGLDIYHRHRTASQPVKTLSDFLPPELKKHCPRTIGSSSRGDQAIGEMMLPTWRDDIAEAYAQPFAARRHENEKNIAREKEEQARLELTQTMTRIADARKRLEDLLAKHYDDQEKCDGKIAKLEQEIETNCAAHITENEKLIKQRNSAEQPLPQDIADATDRITESCNSANKSWYQGLFSSGMLSVTVAVVGLAYSWFSNN